MIEFKHVTTFGRDKQDVSQPFARFKLRIKLSKLKKAKVIKVRDGMGRIIYSQPPPVMFEITK